MILLQIPNLLDMEKTMGQLTPLIQLALKKTTKTPLVLHVTHPYTTDMEP